MTPRASLHLLALGAVVFCGFGGLQAGDRTYCLFVRKLTDLTDGTPFELRSAPKFGDSHELPRWTINIDNNANWIAEISGTTIEQSEDLSPGDFADNFVHLEGIPPELAKYGMTEKITATGYLEFIHNDTRRLLPISNRNIVLTYGCGERSKP